MAYIGDLLRLPSLLGATIVTGNTNNYHRVLSANVMAVPDIAMWAQPGDFLISTGFIFQDQPRLWRTLVKQLTDIGVATLAFKPGRFVSEIPHELLDAAEIHALPLILLPEHVVFSRAVFEIVEYILTETTTAEHPLMELMRLGFDHGLPAVVHEISSRFNRSLALYSKNGRVIANSGFDVSDLYIPERSAINHPDTIKLIPMPQKISGQSLLLAVGNLHSHPPEGYKGDIYLIRNILSIIIVQQEITLSVEQRYRDMFFRDWFHGHRYETDEILSWSHRLGIYSPTCFRIVSLVTLNSSLVDAWTLLVETEPSLASCGTLVGNDIVLVEPADIHTAQLSEILDGLDISCVGGWSSVHTDYQNVLLAIDQARVSRIIAKEKLGSGFLQYDQLGADLLLHELAKNQNAATFCQNLFNPLLEYDRENNTSFLLTLKTYLESRRIKDTAAKLYTHYNTVLYRLARIQEILSVSLDDPEAQFVLQLGLRMMPYFDTI